MNRQSIEDMDGVAYEQIVTLCDSILQSMLRGDSYSTWRRTYLSEMERTDGLMTKSGTGYAFYDYVTKLISDDVASNIYEELHAMDFVSMCADKRGKLLSCIIVGLDRKKGLRRLNMGLITTSDKRGDTVASAVRRNVPSQILKRLTTITSDAGSENLPLPGHLGGGKWFWCSPHRLDKAMKHWCGKTGLSDVMDWVKQFSGLVRNKDYLSDDLMAFVGATCELSEPSRSSFVDCYQRWHSKLRPLSNVVSHLRSIISLLKNVSATYEDDKKLRDQAHELMWKIDADFVLKSAVASDILALIKHTSEKLEADDCDLATCAQLLNGLRGAIDAYQTALRDVLLAGESVLDESSQVGQQALQSVGHICPYLVEILRTLQNPIDLLYRRRGKGKNDRLWSYMLSLKDRLSPVLNGMKNSLTDLHGWLESYFSSDFAFQDWLNVFGLDDSSEDWEVSVVNLSKLFGLKHLWKTPQTIGWCRHKAQKMRTDKPELSTLQIWSDVYASFADQMSEWSDEEEHASWTGEINDVLTLTGYFLTTPVNSSCCERSFSAATKIKTKKSNCSDETLRRFHLVGCAYSCLPRVTSLYRDDEGTLVLCDLLQRVVSKLYSADSGRTYRRLMGLRQPRKSPTMTNTDDVGGLQAVQKQKKRKLALESAAVVDGVEKKRRKPRRKVNPEIRPQHVALLKQHVTTVPDKIPLPADLEDSFQAKITKTSSFNAAAFIEVPLLPLDVYGDTWCETKGEHGMIMLALTSCQGRFLYHERPVIVRYIQRMVKRILHVCAWQENVWYGAADRLRTLVYHVTENMDLGRDDFWSYLEKDDASFIAQQEMAYEKDKMQIALAKMPRDRVEYPNDRPARIREIVSNRG